MKLIITKAELSRMLNVSRARVSQFVQLGMPVRDDGRLGTIVALQWVVGNIMPTDTPGGVAYGARRPGPFGARAPSWSAGVAVTESPPCPPKSCD